MHLDKFSQPVYSEADLCDLFMQDPDRIIKGAIVDTKIKFDDSLELVNIPELLEHRPLNLTVEEFDILNQAEWYMPEEYATMDIAKWVLDKCTTDEQLQRAGDELLKFNDRDMFVLLRYLKYLVDTMRQHNIVWGVGRGSSVASYVLFLIGVHRIDSLYYDLSIDEFLK